MQATPGPHLFLSPVAKAQFDGDVEVSYVLPATVSVPPDSLASLLLWKPGETELLMGLVLLCFFPPGCFFDYVCFPLSLSLAVI